MGGEGGTSEDRGEEMALRKQNGRWAGPEGRSEGNCGGGWQVEYGLSGIRVGQCGVCNICMCAGGVGYGRGKVVAGDGRVAVEVGTLA